jgi:hypothetical protein
LTSAREQKEQVQALSDPFARSSLRAAYHFRKYALLYVCGLLGALSLAIFPVVNGSGSNAPSLPGSGSVAAGNGSSSSANSPSAVNGLSSSGSGSSGSGSAGSSSSGLASGATGSAAGSGASSSGSSGGVTSNSGPVGSVQTGTGTTAAGRACSSGVHQIPWSNYSDLCVAKFTGNNGGAVTRGVTGSTITISVRQTSDSQGANALEGQAETKAAGGVDSTTNWGYIQSMVKWLNGQYELYGRHVALNRFSGQGNGTNEALGQGQAAACADADTAANSVHAFGDFNWSGIFESGVYSDCAARYHIYIPEGAPYYPESWYAQRAPYVWGITMNCSLISYEVGEWVGKQIAPFPTKWAGNDGVVSLNGKQRKFGVYVPNNAEYQECVNISLGVEQGPPYNIAKSRENQYNYALDISTFPQDAQKAIVQFAAADDTTVVLACDPISPIFLTQDAVQQNYYPEWAIIGVAGTDTDNYGQLWDQKSISGHMWGLSQLASSQIALSPSSDAGRSLTAMGVPINISTVTDYYELISMFNQLQASGPDLTAANIAAHTPNIPGPANGPFGTWDYGKTYTAIIDSRQVYWNANAKSQANGKAGTFVEIYGGQRFTQGHYPTGEPPYYS